MPNLRKTKLCPRFAQGRCTADRDCKYAHTDQELRATVDFYKTSLCSEWALSGQCSRAEACRYAHGPHELRAPGGGSPAPGAIAAAAAKLAAPGALVDLAAQSSPSLRPPPSMPPAMPPTLPPSVQPLSPAAGLPSATSTSPMQLPLAQLMAGSEGASRLPRAPPPGVFVRSTGGSGRPAGDAAPFTAALGALSSPWPAALATPAWPPPPPLDSAPLVLPDTAREETALPGPPSSGGNQQADTVNSHQWLQQPPPGDPPLPQDIQSDGPYGLWLPPAQAPRQSGDSLVNSLSGLLPSPPFSAPHIGLASTGGAGLDRTVWTAHHDHSLLAAVGMELEKVSDQSLASHEFSDVQSESKLNTDSAKPRQALAVGPIGTSRFGLSNIRAIGGGGAKCNETGGGRDALSPWHVLPLTRLPVTPEKLLPDDPTTDEGDSASDGSGSMTHRSRPMSSFQTHPPPGLSLDGQRRVC